MPNWCSNYLTVAGPEEVVEQFCRTVETGMSPDRALDAARHLLTGQQHTDTELEQLANSLKSDDYQPLSFAKTVPSDSREHCIERWGTNGMPVTRGKKNARPNMSPSGSAQHGHRQSRG